MAINLPYDPGKPLPQDPLLDGNNMGQGKEAISGTSRVPIKYRIGGALLESPLVSIRRVKAHLTLLRAFKSLKTNIQERTSEDLRLPPIVSELSKEQRWAWFVALAVER